MTKVAETELIGTCQVLMEHIWNVHKWAKNSFNAHTTAINVMVFFIKNSIHSEILLINFVDYFLIQYLSFAIYSQQIY